MAKKKEIVITPKARLSFANLFTAKPNDRGVMQYKATLIWPLSAAKELAKLQEAVKACAIEEFGKYDDSIKKPFKQQKSAEKLAKYPVFKDSVYVEAVSQYAPGVLDEKKQPVLDQKLIYAGCYVVASLSPYPWTHPTNGKGIGLNINGVMKVAEGERLGRTPGAEFDDVVIEENVSMELDSGFDFN